MLEFCAFMRSRGWRHPIIILKQGALFVGVASPRQLRCTHDNDNG